MDTGKILDRYECRSKAKPHPTSYFLLAKTKHDEFLHEEGEVAGLAFGDVGGEHEDGDCGDGESKDDYEFREIGLIGIVRMLVIDVEVDIEDEDDHTHHYCHDQQH
ncbi:hypothetical protein MRB53_019898 [Persea americana]|uniref:Uncharacterized protein n=1 Tax=Persea americana TaxID=3435 RepID=A0ACC2KZC5_PERAE|nr:hypothetical protein MRB53_019898 [Persea americana]